VIIETKLLAFYGGVGTLVGCLSGVLSKMNIVAYAPLLLAFAFFYLAYKLAMPALKIVPAQFPGGKKKLITGGIVSYFFLWILFWIVAYTFLVQF